MKKEMAQEMVMGLRIILWIFVETVSYEPLKNVIMVIKMVGIMHV